MDIQQKMKIYHFLDKHPKLKKCLVTPYRKLAQKYTTAEEPEYNQWIIQNEPTRKDLKKQKKYAFEKKYKISVVVPLFETQEYFLAELIRCLKQQTYSNWELCLADGSPQKLEFVQKYLKDERIQYKWIGENKGISGNTNEAIQMATGDFIGLLDHDDLLAPFALFEVMKAIEENPEAQFLYSDEDRIEGEFHKRKNMFFKPDFSKYTLRSANYICHFSVFKRELMNKLGGLQCEYDGSQDFDLVLRASEKTDKICHIPKVLYHWRDHAGSTAENSDAKPYAYEVAKKVIKDHFERCNIPVQIKDGISSGSYEIQYLVKGNPKVAILVETEGISDKAKFEEHLKNNFNDKNTEIVMLNENVFEQCQKLDADYFMIVDQNFVDVQNKDWIQDLVGIAQNDDVGIVGSKLYNKQGTVEHCGIVLGMNGAGDFLYKGVPKDMPTYMQRLKIIHNVSAVYYKYAMIDKKAFAQIPEIDFRKNELWTSIDLCLKLQKMQKQVVMNPLVEICVNEIPQNNTIEPAIEIPEDPYFSPNLSKKTTYLSINL